jgi:replicative DNA helicase
MIAQGDAENSDSSDLINETSEMMIRLATGDRKTVNAHVSDGMKGVVDDIVDRMENGNRPRGLLTGLVDLDRIVQGLRPGQMIVIAGRPGSGKTTLAMNIADHNAMTEKHAQIFSLEMTLHELNTRQLSSIGKIPMNAISTGDVGEYMPNIAIWKQRVQSMSMTVCDRGGMTMTEIRSIARLQKQMGKLDLVVIDYIGLVKTSGAKNSTRTQELGAVSRECKEMAKELDVPVIVLAQLNREIEKGGERDPRLSDLRDSGEIEQDADIVIFVSKAQEDGVSKATVAKHRHAKPGDCYLMHRGEFSRFDSIAHGYEAPVQLKPRSSRSMF